MGLGKAALSLSKLPSQEWILPELPTWLVLGKSNVGKSSLLNALIHPQEIFRSGSTPGVTRGLVGATITMGRKELFILDLPGWGFSVRSPIEKKSWDELGSKLTNAIHPDISQMIWLVDPRRDFDQSEADVLAWLGNLNWFLVFTKSDQVKRSERKKRENEWRKAVGASVENLLWVSTKDGEGMTELMGRARTFVRQISESEEG
jgi:GTP-binding protein